MECLSSPMNGRHNFFFHIDFVIFNVNREIHKAEEINCQIFKKILNVRVCLVTTDCLLQQCTLFIQVLHVRVFVSHQTVQYTSYTLHGAVKWITLVVLKQHFKVVCKMLYAMYIDISLLQIMNHVLKSYNVEGLIGKRFLMFYIIK